jgi:DNA invertase Pin-like site-specific DNA recombinase
MKVVGLGRASTNNQDLTRTLQEIKIKQYCELYGLQLVGFVYDEGVSGSKRDREGLNTALETLEAGIADGLVVYKLDRLTRSLSHLNELIDEYFRDRFTLYSVCENLDTESPSGRLVINILGSVAQWERETISERTKAALEVKKLRGERLGRPREIPDETIHRVKELRIRDYTQSEIAEALGISASSVSQILRR